MLISIPGSAGYQELMFTGRSNVNVTVPGPTGGVPGSWGHRLIVASRKIGGPVPVAGAVNVVGFELVVVVGFTRVVVVGFGLAVVEVVAATPGPAASASVVVAVEDGGGSAAEADTALFPGAVPTDTVVT